MDLSISEPFCIATKRNRAALREVNPSRDSSFLRARRKLPSRDEDSSSILEVSLPDIKWETYRKGGWSRYVMNCLGHLLCRLYGRRITDCFDNVFYGPRWIGWMHSRRGCLAPFKSQCCCHTCKLSLQMHHIITIPPSKRKTAPSVGMHRPSWLTVHLRERTRQTIYS